MNKWNLDDKDVAMVGIVVLCIVGWIVLAVANETGASIGALFTGGIRKEINHES